MASTKSSDFHHGQWFPLKSMIFAKRNGFREKEYNFQYWQWFPLNAMFSTKRNGLHEKEWFPLK